MGKFVIKPSGETGYRFNLKAGNGEVIATASQTYKSLATCKTGIKSVQKNAAAANLEDQTSEGFSKQKNPKYEIYADKSEKIRFRLKAKNGEIIAVSQGYKSLAACLKGVESVRANAPEAEIAVEKADAGEAPAEA